MKSPSSQPARRGFLKGASALAAPFLLPSRIWSAPIKPNDQITVGFIGMGKQSRGLLGNFMKSGARVLAVSDVDQNRRTAEKDRVDAYFKNKDCAAYEDYREIIARKDIDSVCIATPDHWHAIQTLDALKAGKDVYCEKPLTHNIQEAIAIMKAVPKHKRVLQTGSMQRSSREFRVACELVRNGLIGTLERVTANFGGPGIPCDLPEEPMEKGLNWDLWLGPAPLRPYHSTLSPRGVHNHFPRWRSYREYGGGMVTDWGAHQLDIAQWGLGRDQDGPVEVRPPNSPGATHGAQLVYEDGITVTHGKAGGVTFYGSEGSIFVHRGLFGFSRKGRAFATKFDRTRDKAINLGSQLDFTEATFLQDPKVKLDQSPGHVPDFLACMRSRKKPITHEGIGARTAICCHLMNLAYYHGTRFRWDPQKNAFAGSEAKPEWITRAYRGPWNV